MRTDIDAVVVGAGVAGAMAAWALAERGRQTLLLERYQLGNRHGSSHGRSRVADPDACARDVPVHEHAGPRLRADRIGAVVIGSACSGHGFKASPIVGRILADLATGAQPSVPLGRYRAPRPALRPTPEGAPVGTEHTS
jgi:glycine/D-amino acid oxidase-like deaminating enzyme